MTTETRRSNRPMSVTQVAAHFEINRDRVLRAIRSGKLKAYKIGWTWVVKESELPLSWHDL